MSKKRKRPGGNPGRGAENRSATRSRPPEPGGDGPAARLVELALAEGVDLADPMQVQAFMDRFNAMPEAWRAQALPDEVLNRSQFTVQMAPADDPGNGVDLDALDEFFELEEQMEFPARLEPAGLESALNDFCRYGSRLAVPRHTLLLRDWAQRTGRLQVTKSISIRQADLGAAIELLGLKGADLALAKGLRQPRMEHYPALVWAWDLLIAFEMIHQVTQTKIEVFPSEELDALLAAQVTGRVYTEEQAGMAMELLAIAVMGEFERISSMWISSVQEAAETIHFLAKTMIILGTGHRLRIPVGEWSMLQAGIVLLLRRIEAVGLIDITSDGVIQATAEGAYPLATLGIEIDPVRRGRDA